MDYLSLIKQPIVEELNDFIEFFNKSLEHDNGLLSQALNHIRQRAGKRTTEANGERQAERGKYG